MGKSQLVQREKKNRENIAGVEARIRTEETIRKMAIQSVQLEAKKNEKDRAYCLLAPCIES